MYDYSVSVAVAAVYSEFPIPIWFKWIRRGWISASPPLPDGKLDLQIAQLIHIPLRTLPRPAATHYLQDYLLKDSFFSFNFISILDQHGKAGLHLFLENLTLIKRMNRIRSEHPLDATSHLSELSARYHCSLSTLYRKESILMNSELRKLIEASTVSEASPSSSFQVLQEKLVKKQKRLVSPHEKTEFSEKMWCFTNLSIFCNSIYLCEQ